VFNDSTLYYLNQKHNRNLTLNEWIVEMDSKIVQELNSAGYTDLEFFSSRTNPGKEIDLFFFYDLSLWSVDKDHPEDKYANSYTRDGVIYFTNQKRVFRMRSQLDLFSTCVPLYSSALLNEEALEEDIFQLIKNIISLNWPLDRRIWNWEAEHLAPARKPKMEISYEKEYLSPLDRESRKMDVKIKIKNCRGQYVFNQFHSQPVYFTKETDRLKSKSDIKCTDGPDWGSFRTIMTNSEFEAICEYSVNKGTDPSVQKPIFKTCGIGTNSLIEHEGEIIVLGLELQVEPERKTIYSGEKTTIQIDLHEIDPDGTEILSCAGKEVDVKVTGLVDGTVSHESGMITLNEAGVAFIDYTAGEKDRQIKISATFTPPGYPEEVKGGAIITVKKPEGEFTGTLTYKRHVNWKDESKQPAGSSSTSVELDENGSINVAARFLRTYREENDVIELYEAAALSGNCSVVMKKISIITDWNGDWTKIVDSWQGDKMIEPESGSNLLLSVNTTKNTYTITSSIIFAPVEGTTELSTSKGTNSTSDAAESWSVNASIDVEGSLKGSQITGNWSEPAADKMAVSSQTGLLPGCTWNWSLSRTKRVSK